MLAAQHDFTIEVGAVFIRQIQWKDEDGNPHDLTGYEAAMEIRPSEDSSVVIKRLDTTEGTIVLGSNGLITLTLNASETKDLDDYKRGVYSLKMYPGGVDADAIRILEGNVFFSREATQL